MVDLNWKPTRDTPPPRGEEEFHIWTDTFDEDDDLAKALSAAFGSRSRRKAQLVSRLKQARGYDNPVKGGTGKQFRSRRKRFNKADE